MQDFGHETVGIVQYIIANLTASIISVTGSDSSITCHLLPCRAKVQEIPWQENIVVIDWLGSSGFYSPVNTF